MWLITEVNSDTSHVIQHPVLGVVLDYQGLEITSLVFFRGQLLHKGVIAHQQSEQWSFRKIQFDMWFLTGSVCIPLQVGFVDQFPVFSHRECLGPSST